MANKRDFKKAVDAVGASVIDEMMIAYYNVQNADKEAIANSVSTILGAIEKAKDNSNVYFDKGVKAFENKAEYAKAKKGFFKALFNKIHTEFSEQIDQAVKAFNNAIPQEVKEHNKIVAKEA